MVMVGVRGRFINVHVNVPPVPPNFSHAMPALLPRIFEAVWAPQGKFLTPICTETTHWGTVLERIGPCLRVIYVAQR